MKSHKIFTDNSGFTVIELVVTIALLGIVSSLGFGLGWGNYRTTTFRSDIQLLVTLLNHARTKAIQHNEDSSVIFSPGEISMDNQTFPLSLNVSPANYTITFLPVSGRLASPVSLILKNDSLSKTLRINEEGTIDYQ